MAGISSIRILTFSPAQRRAGWTAGGFAFVIIGLAGETLPGASAGRLVAVEWWNYVVLVLDSVLIGLIAATFARGSRAADRRDRTMTGVSGLIGTAALACPACSPLAIPLFGAGGILAFMAPDRGLVAFLSTALLAVTLVLRLRGSRSCEIEAQR